MYAIRLFCFSAAWIAVIYLCNCLFARRRLLVSWRPAVIVMSTMAALGLFGEVVFDTIYCALLKHPLWEYHMLPIHHAYTSLYSLYIWGAIGFHLYLLHGTLRRKGIISAHALAAFFCLEAILLEALANLSYLAFFHTYIYYYLPTDMWHITSLQTLPLYLLAGYITVTAIRLARKTPRYALAGNTAVLILLLAVR